MLGRMMEDAASDTVRNPAIGGSGPPTEDSVSLPDWNPAIGGIGPPTEDSVSLPGDVGVQPSTVIRPGWIIESLDTSSWHQIDTPPGQGGLSPLLPPPGLWEALADYEIPASPLANSLQSTEAEPAPVPDDYEIPASPLANSLQSTGAEPAPEPARVPVALLRGFPFGPGRRWPLATRQRWTE
jgi:hypothetical protein